MGKGAGGQVEVRGEHNLRWRYNKAIGKVRKEGVVTIDSFCNRCKWEIPILKDSIILTGAVILTAPTGYLSGTTTLMSGLYAVLTPESPEHLGKAGHRAMRAGELTQLLAS